MNSQFYFQPPQNGDSLASFVIRQNILGVLYRAGSPVANQLDAIAGIPGIHTMILYVIYYLTFIFLLIYDLKTNLSLLDTVIRGLLRRIES